MWLKRKNGFKLSESANFFNISIEEVRKIVRKTKSSGRAEKEYRAGRPRLTTPRKDQRIIRLAHVNTKASAH